MKEKKNSQKQCTLCWFLQTELMSVWSSGQERLPLKQAHLTPSGAPSGASSEISHAKTPLSRGALSQIRTGIQAHEQISRKRCQGA